MFLTWVSKNPRPAFADGMAFSFPWSQRSTLAFEGIPLIELANQIYALKHLVHAISSLRPYSDKDHIFGLTSIQIQSLTLNQAKDV
jgi:hypothetical protein